MSLSSAVTAAPDASARLGRLAVLLNVDTMNSSADARAFLSKFAMSYPGCRDPAGSTGRALALAVSVPTPVGGLDATGRRGNSHQRAHGSETNLVSDICRDTRER